MIFRVLSTLICQMWIVRGFTKIFNCAGWYWEIGTSIPYTVRYVYRKRIRSLSLKIFFIYFVFVSQWNTRMDNSMSKQPTYLSTAGTLIRGMVIYHVKAFIHLYYVDEQFACEGFLSHILSRREFLVTIRKFERQTMLLTEFLRK